MDTNELIIDIVEKEWPMFHNVNGEDKRVDCQEDKNTFVIMRTSQYMAWSRKALDSYYKDLCAAIAEGRNLAREKYIRMMESSDPANFELFKTELPPVTDEAKSLVDEILTHMLAQTRRMNEKYPVLAMASRPVNSEDDQSVTSIETYQRSELLTYSLDTIKAFYENILELETQGIDFVEQIQANAVVKYGYKDLDAAEEATAWNMMQAMGASSGGCCCCEDA